MTNKEEFCDWVKCMGGRLYLSDIVKTKFCCEYRKYATLMRQDGWIVDVKLNRKEPGKNLYTFIEPGRIKFTPEGQGVFI